MTERSGAPATSGAEPFLGTFWYRGYAEAVVDERLRRAWDSEPPERLGELADRLREEYARHVTVLCDEIERLGGSKA